MEPGSRLGPYEIVARIGAGGMGEVWRARDARLERDVAVKILPADFANDARLKIRFEREAKTLSQLSHPNICTVFDVGENYIVMEMLEGESLAERIDRGPLPLADVLRYGAQLADALAIAHRAGIVHRDLKPGNVMLTKSGAKLLDFGLAKSKARAAFGDCATAQASLTEEGGILGTFQYMAPEQLAGEEADARTDIFALGALLHEMTTGKRAFEGKNRPSLIAAIISGEPRPLRELQALTPPALQHVVTRCLQKERDDRWQSAADVAEELRWTAQAGTETTLSSAVMKPRRWRERILWIAALVVILAMVLWRQSRTRTELPPTVESAIRMDASGGVTYYGGAPAFSPDGSSIAYAAEDRNGQRALWVRQLGHSAPRMLPNTAGAASPFWSADGKYIGFFDDAKVLKRIPAEGGEADVIASAGFMSGGTWNGDGVIVYSAGRSGPLFRVSVGGEPAAVVTAASIGATGLQWPWFLPDGKHFLFLATGDGLQKRDQAGVWMAAADRSEQPRFVAHASSNICYAGGWLLFVRDGVLRAQPFDAKSLRVTAGAIAIAPVQFFAPIASAMFAASSSGMLVYQPPGQVQLSELLMKNRKGEILRRLGRGYFWSPRLSHDGRRIALDQSDEKSGSGDIWIMGIENASASRFTFEAANETAPVWSPDDRTIAYLLGLQESRLAAKRAGAPAETLVNLPGFAKAPTDWSNDGRYIAIYRFGRRPDGDVVALSLADRKIVDIATTTAEEAAAVFSPDSKWIAYQSDESGRSEIYVQPMPPTGAKYQLSTAGGRWPRWRLPGEITYVDETDHLATVGVEAGASLVLQTPQILPVTVENRRQLSWSEYDVAADGSILVNALARNDPPPLTLVTNWPQRWARDLRHIGS
jgi:serine/threonine protein kinase/Tol biopolymer transport system component